ncbi:MAG: ribonuclease HII [Flavobacteriaceae bacterium]
MTCRIILFIVLIFGSSCLNDKSQTRPLLDFIPDRSPLIIKINTLAAFRDNIKSNDFLKDLGTTSTLKTALDKIDFLEMLNDESNGILAFVETEGGNFESIFVTNYGPNVIKKDSVNQLNPEPEDIGNTKLDKYVFKEGTFFSSKEGNKLLFSSSPSILAGTAERLKYNKHSKTLRKLFEISGTKKPGTLYIDVKNFGSVLSRVVKDTSKTIVSNFSDWLSLDINAQPTHLNLSGISMANDSVLSFVDLFANTNPVISITPSLAPATANTLISYNFHDYTIFSKNQQNYLGGTPKSNILFEAMEEVGVIYIDQQKVIILNTHGSEVLADHLNSTKKSAADYQGNEIMAMADSSILSNTLDPVVKDFNANFCTIIKDAFVFAETAEPIQEIIRNYQAGTTFNKTGVYQILEKSLAEESNILFISTTVAVQKIVEQDISEVLNKELTKALQSNYAVASQTIADNNFYHTNLVVQKNEADTFDKGVTEIFAVQFDTILSSQPQLVTNHLNKGMEVVVQDMNNNLYLISPTGKILWKKQLDGLVQGEIKQVDIFKNGRLQLAFTTHDQFMVLDRNGQEVRQFTKKFEGGNLNPLAVFDYDGKKDYRFVITQGEKVFMFDRGAKSVTGFTYTKAEKPIIAAPKHIRTGIKDFLIFKLSDGSLKILNRLGEVRIKVDEKIDFSENEVFLNKDKFTLTDKNGTLYQIDQNGKISKTNFNLSDDHGMYATENTLVLMNDNILTIKGKQLELELGVYTKPKIFYLNDKIYVSVTDLQHELIYLFDSQAEPIANFPIFGSSIIDLNDIDKDKKLEIVVKRSDNSIVSYKLN